MKRVLWWLKMIMGTGFFLVFYPIGRFADPTLDLQKEEMLEEIHGLMETLSD